MLAIRCFKCGWAWSMNPSEVAAALDSMAEHGQTKYYMAECPKCRRANKVPIKRVRRYAPPDWSPPAGKAKAPAPDTGAEQKADGQPKAASGDTRKAK